MIIAKILLSGFLACMVETSAENGIFMPPEEAVPFVGYFTSYYRGTCVCTLVAPRFALTAAVCVTSHKTSKPDTRPITIAVGSHYRHKMRGVRVPIVRVYTSKFSEGVVNKTYEVQHIVAVLQLQFEPVNAHGDFEPKSLKVDLVKGPRFKEECFTVGWNFYTGYPVKNSKFILQKSLHMQVLTVERKEECQYNMDNFNEAMASLKFTATIHSDHFICLKDGMYGAPLVCRGRMMGMLTSPDATHPNCTESIIYHSLNTPHMTEFLGCWEEVLKPDEIDFSSLYVDPKKQGPDLGAYYDYAPDATVEQSSDESD